MPPARNAPYSPATSDGRRFYDANDQWAFCAISFGPGAREFYDQRRAAGGLHHQALRSLGILHGCLRHRTHYDEHIAWDHRHQRREIALGMSEPDVLD